MDVRIADIIIPPGRRALSDTSVRALQHSIEQVGLLQPILLTPDLRLVAGAHRIAACKMLGHETIRAETVDLGDLDRELAEIDENLIRNELTALERGESLARRKTIYEALHPETKPVQERGGPGRGHKTAENISAVSPFAEDAAEKTGVTDRAIRYAVQIGEDITPEARDAIRETPTADNQSDLLRLAKHPELEQIAIAQEVRDTGKTVKEVEREHKREARLQEVAEAVNASEQDGGIEVVCADCLEFMPKRVGEFDCLIADPPYNTGRMEWDEFANDGEFLVFTEDWLALALDCLKPGAVGFVFCNSEYAADVEIILRDMGHRPKSRIVWSHRNLSQGRVVKDQLARTYEVILHFGDRNLNFDESWDDRRFDVQTFAAPQTNFSDEKLHQTQKPLELIKWLVELGSSPGEAILDPFGGAGTTGVACKALGRKCVLVEKNQGFANIAKGRIAEA